MILKLTRVSIRPVGNKAAVVIIYFGTAAGTDSIVIVTGIYNDRYGRV